MTIGLLVVGAVAWALAVHTLVNRLLLRRPLRASEPIHVKEMVSVLLPVRDEEHRVATCVRSLVAQAHLDEVEIIVLDDGSTDRTADVVHAAGGSVVRLVRGCPSPEGWLGKPHACDQLARLARGSVLVFVDADVELAPDAVAASVLLLRRHELAWVSPYPSQEAGSWLGTLVQPLLTWSWLATLPLRSAERSHRRSLAAANGQFLVVDATFYRRAGGHEAVRHDVLDDMGLARALRRVGGRGGFADGAAIARCRMYDGGRALVDGYAKSLWTAFSSPAGAAAVCAGLLLVYVAPLALVWATPLAWLPLSGGVVSRAVAHRRWDAGLVACLLHPLSVLAFSALVAISLLRRQRGTLTWKGRDVA